ncbi:unnamed protein product [Gordionus sp. m RMFG-2023]
MLFIIATTSGNLDSFIHKSTPAFIFYHFYAIFLNLVIPTSNTFFKSEDKNNLPMIECYSCGYYPGWAPSLLNRVINAIELSDVKLDNAEKSLSPRNAKNLSYTSRISTRKERTKAVKEIISCFHTEEENDQRVDSSVNKMYGYSSKKPCTFYKNGKTLKSYLENSRYKRQVINRRTIDSKSCNGFCAKINFKDSMDTWVTAKSCLKYCDESQEDEIELYCCNDKDKCNSAYKIRYKNKQKGVHEFEHVPYLLASKI